MDDFIKLVVEMAKLSGDSGKFSAWRYIALLIAAVIIAVVWRLPEIITALK